MTEIYRSDTIVVRVVPSNDTTQWVVTFDNYGLGPGFDRKGFGEDFLHASGVSAVHVLGRGDDWYQYPDILAAMAAVRAQVAGARRVVTYGSSMGAYAALRLADAAGADGALALSPQFSVDPAKVPFEARWAADGRRLDFRPEIEARIACKARALIVYDAAGADRRHIDLIAREIDADRVGLRHIDHPAAVFLQESGLLGPLVLDFASGRLDIETFRRRADRARRASVTCLALLARRQPPRRSRAALRLAERAVRIAPESAVALSCLAVQLSRSDRHEEAVAVHERATEAGGRSPNHLTSHAHVLVDAGRISEAIVLVREAIAAEPGAAHHQRWLATLLSDAGDAPGALRALERALVLDPLNQAYRASVIEARLNRNGLGGLVARLGGRLRTGRKKIARLWRSTTRP
ncbi:MAG: hypothetical protein KF910_04910 [Brevundimonas sp.]|uniref:tetratricopeptide repeat protein n=1 Tax=Brevundimonas sp. TaxID=1871086 RepID=UPI0025C43821|nr:tetratricopeptide repeat protein [Brevundimonas sp.]MBX3476923.1 hypothetical protein [Brevundimonas sp.]